MLGSRSEVDSCKSTKAVLAGEHGGGGWGGRGVLRRLDLGGGGTVWFPVAHRINRSLSTDKKFKIGPPRGAGRGAYYLDWMVGVGGGGSEWNTVWFPVAHRINRSLSTDKKFKRHLQEGGRGGEGGGGGVGGKGSGEGEEK